MTRPLASGLIAFALLVGAAWLFASPASADLTSDPTATTMLETPAPVIQPVTQTTDPIVEPVVEPVAPIVQPVIEPVAPIVQPVVEPVAPIVEPVIEPVAPIVQPVVEPVAPIVEPVIEPVAPIVEPGNAAAVLNKQVSVSTLWSEQPYASISGASESADQSSSETNGAAGVSREQAFSLGQANFGSTSNNWAPSASAGVLIGVLTLFVAFRLRRLPKVALVFSTLTYAPLTPPS